MFYESEALSLYLSEIGQYDLLTAEEEADLARRIAAGDDAAKEKLINSNLRFAVSIAKKFAKDPETLQDLIQEANFGLIEAAEKFDPKRGRFTTIANFYVTNSILKSFRSNSVKNCIALDAALNEDGFELADTLEDVEGISPESAIEELSDKYLAEEMLASLPEKEADAVRLYYGFLDEAGLTAKDVAEKHNVRVTELNAAQAGGIRKLRKEYKDYNKAA